MRELGLHSYGQVLKPVNGLMCVVDKDNNAICVRNITTGEATSWIQTTIDVERTEGYKLLQKFKIYEFGCDPTTMEHKVICILSMCKTQSCTQYEVCEVLTVCDNTWTRINAVPGLPYDYNLKESVNVNGVIYWFTCKYLGNSNKHEYPSFILAFDVGKEKFRKITLPNSYLDKPCDHILYFCCSTLLQVDGHVALMRRQSDRTVKLWLLNDKNKESGTKSGTDTNWYADTITLPSDISWDEKSRPQFYSVEGTDRIIIETNKDYYRHVCHASLHSYNWKKRSFGEVKFNGMPYSVPCCSSINHFRTFSESLLPVQKKLRQSTTLQLG
ncbi:putative F-box protein At1g32420 [Papaver somniferum]|uniref:putative F-box protein At1g32420 n=1 Tax=Papaver somniferum TaxID=3469 RepID=UPI000E6FFFE6|nr:putative F-box protein At1g32420 [Papaver somniferum]